MRSPLPALCLAVAAIVVACVTAAAADRPNVVVLISDDAGYADLGFTGGALVATPNLDGLAASGATLPQFYTTASVCSPSRAGFLTGRYQQRFGHHSNLTGPASTAGLGLPLSERTLADHLKARGYATALVGKWHLGSAESLLPTRRGFDEFRGVVAGSRSYFADPGADNRHALRRERVAGPESADTVFVDESAEPALYVTDWLAGEAAAFIDAHADGETPFLLVVSFTAPHTPMHATRPDLDAVGDVAPDTRRTYAAMVRALDRAVGQLRDAIERNGIARNTITMYFNDNGGATNNGSDNGRFRGMKGSKWEGGVRVPAFVSWPGVIPAGMAFTPVVSSMDLTATAVALAGGPIPEAAPLDGIDLMPLLTRAGPWPDDAVHETLFWERGPAAAVRHGPWKLIVTDATEPLLFHVPADPSETTDLAADRPDVVDALRERLEAWRSETVEPLWTEGERWEDNQRAKHRMRVLGREAERELP